MNIKKTLAFLIALCSVTHLAMAFENSPFHRKALENVEPVVMEVETSNREVNELYAPESMPQMRQSKNATADGVEIFAFTEYNVINESKQGLIKFNSATPGSITRVKNVTDWATAGAYAQENYYVMVSVMSYMPTLYTVDLESGEVLNPITCDLPGDYPRQALEMSYDVVSKKMYMLAFSETDIDRHNTALLTVDLVTGEQNLILDNMGRHFYTMAINAEGEMYGVDGTGMLCKINKDTGEATEIASTGLQPLFRQSMDFDRETGVVYWAYSDKWRYGTLYTLDVATAAVTKIGEIGDEEQQIVGVHVPYSLYKADAPAAVEQLAVTPHEGGALSATISWKNPSTTIEGNNLAAIERVEVSRDGALVATLTNATPGEAMSWTDNVDASAMYTYKVQAFNEKGQGELRTAQAFVGRDLPAAIEHLRLQRSTEHSITLSWDAVENGMNGGYVDCASMRYNVVRVSDNTILASDLSETTFVDNSIAELGRYRYAIEAYNIDGKGGVTTSGYIVNGPARSLPLFANFDVKDATEPNLWTIGDANGDGISFFWNYDNNIRKGAFFYQTYNMSDANDWLISPPTRFEANMPYKFVVSAAPASSSQPEKFTIHLIQNYDLSTAIAVSEEFVVDHRGEYRAEIDSIPAGVYMVCIQCTSDAMSSNYLSIYSVEVAENGDGNIRGDVWDDEMKPVADVYVSLEGTEFGAYTDSRGFFEISNVPADDYMIVCTKLGYKNNPVPVAVKALGDVNVELDVVRRFAVTASGRLTDEYGNALANANVEMTGYNNYVATSDSDGRYTINNVYETVEPYNIKISKPFYTTEYAKVSVDKPQAIVLDATLNDSILPPAMAMARLSDDLRSVALEWSAPAIDVSVMRHSNEASSSFGASDGTFGTLIGVVSHEPVILDSIYWFSFNLDEYINVVVLELDANGKLTGRELYVDSEAPNQGFNRTTYKFDTPVYAPTGCFIGLSVDYGFLDLVTVYNTPEYPFVPNFNAYIEDYTVKAEYDYVESLGEDYAENFYFGYYGKLIANEEAPAVTYTLSRHNESGMSELLSESVATRTYTDNAWLPLADGDYTYSVTAVYGNKQTSTPTYTQAVNHNSAGVEGIVSAGFDVVVEEDVLWLNVVASEVVLYTTDGVQVAHDNNINRMSVHNCPAGIYLLRACVEGQWHVEKVLIK